VVPLEVVSTTTTVVTTIIYMLVALVGGYWLWTNPAKFDGHSLTTARGVRLYLLAFCLIIAILGITSLALLAAGDG
jgi:hypothetical protein